MTIQDVTITTIPSPRRPLHVSADSKHCSLSSPHISSAALSELPDSAPTNSRLNSSYEAIRASLIESFDELYHPPGESLCYDCWVNSCSLLTLLWALAVCVIFAIIFATSGLGWQVFFYSLASVSGALFFFCLYLWCRRRQQGQGYIEV